MADSRFENVKYVSWLKVSMALIFAKEGLEKLTDKLAKEFHDDIKNRLVNSECSSCSKDDLKKQWQNGRWRCRANVCNRWLDEIRRNLQHPKETIEWDNSDISCLPSKPWECIKLFMSYGCETVTEAAKADIAAILTLFINNSYFFNHVGGSATANNFEKVKEIRNSIMHSCTLELEETKMEEYMDTITKMLKCHPTLDSDQSCKEAISKIQKLKSEILEEYESRSLNARIKTCESKFIYLNTQKNEIEELRTNDMGIQRDVDIINSKYRELYWGSQELKTEVENMNGFLSNLRANGIENIDFGIINENITSLVNDIDEMKYDIVEIKQKFARMESENSNETLYEKRKKGLQRSLIELYKNDCCSVPICSLRPNLTRTLDVLYVKQSMVERNPRVTSKLQVYMSPSSISIDEQENGKIETLEDVFFKDRKLCKNIYMTGEAGVGKSTFCVHLLDVWLKSHGNLDTPDSEDLQTMKQFSFLFFTHLRGVRLDSNSDVFINIISEQLGLDMNIKEILNRENCLILADALDESVGGVPFRALWNKSTMLITSRHWKIETLRDFIEGKTIDRQIEMIGLDEESAEKLIKNVLPILAEESESESNMKSSSDFMAEIKEKDLDEFLKVPIILKHMLCLWHDNHSIGNSYFSIYKNIVHYQIMVYMKSKHKGMSLTNKDKINYLRCKSNCPCIYFGELLVQVGQLAFKSLVSENRANELVFDHNIAQIHGMSKKCIEICLRIGILSQYKLFGNILEYEKYMSFVHKTNQEYHAAIYLAHEVQVSELKSVLTNVICNLDKILELEKVIIFVSALNPKMGREMTKLLLEAAEQDLRIQNYRRTVALWSSHFELVFNLQKVILDAMKESRLDQNQQQFNLDDIVVYHENMSCVLSCLSETSRITSIHIRGESEKYILDDNIMMHIKDTSRLQRIELYLCTISRPSILQNMFSNVVALSLGWVQISHSNLASVCSRLATAENLRQLLLEWIECETHGELEEGLCRALRLNLSRLDKLEKLYIGPCELPVFVISPVLTDMKQIILDKVTTTAAILEELVNNLPENNVRVKLWGCKICNEDGASSPNAVIQYIRQACRIKYDRVEMRYNGDFFVDKLEFYK